MSVPLPAPAPLEERRIYFALRGDLIKIGITSSLHYRMRALGAELLASFEGTVLDERAMHRHFAEFSVGGEWFLDCPEIRDVVAELNAPPPPAVPAPVTTSPPACATYTLAEARALLGISRNTADRLAATGRLHPDVPCVKVGGLWKVPKAALDSLLGIAS